MFEIDDIVQWTIHIWAGHEDTRQAKVLLVEGPWVVLQNDHGTREPFVRKVEGLTLAYRRPRLAVA